MAHVNQLPCDGDGTCMVCKLKPPAEETLTCQTCATPWHVACLASGRPDTMADALTWECPDCSPDAAVPVVAVSGGSADLMAAIRAIESDASLSEQEKAKRRQELLGGVPGPSDDGGEQNLKNGNDVIDIIDGRLKCSFCMQLPDRPVTTPCGHNFCLKCFEKWVKQGKTTCANCRNEIPHKMRSQPRINSALVIAIRMAKMPKSNYLDAPEKVYHFICNQDRPDAAYTTERAKKPGKANACSGRIFVTVSPDHFGPILAKNDPRLHGVLVGEFWEDRMECRQWGAHRPHVAGIAGQSTYGAQSVALSGGYEDDEDHGEWFLYTGSGGRDLSGNKRTNKEQSSDQKFEKLNEALRVSCIHGYPVRVVRSHKEKSSSYAPEKGVRYDGVYRIEKCWRKLGIQKKLVCRYLFVRCDNEPAPWTSDEHGDRPRPLPNIKELKVATDITERTDPPSWDFDEEKGCWMWKKPPPPSKQQQSSSEVITKAEAKAIKRRFQQSMKEKLLKEFSCQLCKKVMNMPITTPCAHNFCKGCLEDAFAGQTLMKQRNCGGRRTLRAQKNIMKCPSPYCNIDIADFLQNPQVNRELMGLIESLQKKNEEEEEEEEESDEENNDAATEKLEAVAEDEDPSSEEVQVEEMAEVNVVVAKEDEEPKKADSKVEAVEEVNKEDNDVTVELKEKAKQQQKLRGDVISDRATKRTKIAAET